MANKTYINLPAVDLSGALRNLMFAFCLFTANTQAFAAALPPIVKKSLVKQFYEKNGQRLFWFRMDNEAMALRNTIKNILGNASCTGLNPSDYHFQEIATNAWTSFCVQDSLRAMRADMVFTEAAILYCSDLRFGKNISDWISSDQVSEKYVQRDEQYILNGLLNAGSAEELNLFIASLEPETREYKTIRDSLMAAVDDRKETAIEALSVSLNFIRWFTHFGLNEYIVVNIPSNELKYYRADTALLSMKVVTGKPSTRTPRFAAYCDQVVLYPYWNVPATIAAKELLPLFKRRPQMVNTMNMQVIDGKGNIIDPAKLDWTKYDKDNFPYRIRQSTGCDNALGVIKFNLTSPYDVYMHDTNLKSAFLSDRRYLSHGCIRLEKPIELGNYLLRNKLDDNFLASCLKDQKPVIVTVPSPVAVFVVYMPATVDETGKLILNKDVYHLVN